MTLSLHATRPRIAVVEDDQDLLDSTLEYLQAGGYPAWGSGSAEAFYKRFSIEPVDVVVLDIGLPGEDGIAVANHLRGLADITVIIVSAHHALEDRLAGLKAGADRYLVKPVDFGELVANIEAVGRRSAHPAAAAAAQAERGAQQADLWRLSKQDWSLTTPEGKTLVLTSSEFTLLHYLFSAKGEPVPKKTISNKLFGPRILNGNERIDVLLARLRKKSLAALGQPLPVKTAHHVGYAFTASSICE